MRLTHAQVPGVADAPIDWTHLTHATLGDSSLAREVLGLFLEQVDGFVAGAGSLQQATPAEVHRLKGAARAIGAWPIAEAAQRVERDRASSGDAAAAWATLAARIASARAAILTHLDDAKADAGAAHIDSL